MNAKILELKPTNLATAKRYGISLAEIVEDFAVYGYHFSHVAHFDSASSQYGRAVDFIFMRANEAEDETLYQITIEHGNCPECLARCVAWGWGEGGYHSSTCECGTIDYN